MKDWAFIFEMEYFVIHCNLNFAYGPDFDVCVHAHVCACVRAHTCLKERESRKGLPGL
jgi:hypothetical protein